MRPLFLLFVVCIFSLSLSAQGLADRAMGVLEGSVKDELSSEPLPGAGIWILDGKSSAISNPLGNFQLSALEPGIHQLAVSMPGYATDTVEILVQARDTSRLEIGLYEDGLRLEEVEIRALSNPENSLLSRLDLSLRNVTSGQEILQLTPGLIIAQHAGGGKAEQLFFRGFDLDHGTDLALHVDGIPVNLVSHAHGQGYSDLHFLIPETVNRVHLNKGPHSVEEGNFATSGSMQLTTFDQLKDNLVRTEYGSFGTSRTLAMLGLPTTKTSPVQGYVAGEFLTSRGYFEQPQALKRLNMFGKASWEAGPRTKVRGTLSLFQSSWNASGQIPERAVANGSITRFGSIDPTEGGATSRQQASLELINTFSNKSQLEQQVYAVNNTFLLNSNFTFFFNNPLEGDRIRQTEDRRFYGYQGNWQAFSDLASLPLLSKVGWGLRNDQVNDLELAWINRPGELRDQIQFGQVRETNAFAFVEEQISLHNNWKLNLGLRYDLFRFGYLNQLDKDSQSSDWQGRISPKVQLNWVPKDELQLFAKVGTGFHSNDSRSASLDASEALPRATGADLGLIWKPAPRILLQATAWGLHLDQELVYVGDEGIVETSGASRRIGMDLSARFQISEGLVASGDLNYAHARYVEGGQVPLAPILSSRAGLYGQFNDRWSGGMGYRLLMDRPATEDGNLTAKGFFQLEASAQWKATPWLNLGVNANNLLNQVWNEAQFATTSQLRNESQPVTEIHFTPGAPRSYRAHMEFLF